MGKFACTGVIAAIVLAGPAWSVPATTALIAETQAALDRGDPQHAANLANEALGDAGVPLVERGRLLLYRGLAEELLGSHETALRDFTDALDIHALPAQEREQALLQRGFLRDGLGQLDEAVKDYSAVIALKGDSLTTALNNRANIYRRQKQFGQARRDYQAALAVEGVKPQYAWYGLGQIAEAQGDLLSARGFYAKAVSADPGYALASERLEALGGPADDAISDSEDRIILRPPKVASAIENTRHDTKGIKNTVVLAADNAASVQALPIVLHPPRGETQYRDGPSVRSMRGTSAADVALRPALDQVQQAARPAELGHEVQLGAWRSEGEASAGWDKAKSRAGGALSGLSPHIVAADLPGKGRYYRLRVAVTGQSRAAFCAGLSARGVACLPARD